MLEVASFHQEHLAAAGGLAARGRVGGGGRWLVGGWSAAAAVASRRWAWLDRGGGVGRGHDNGGDNVNVRAMATTTLVM